MANPSTSSAPPTIEQQDINLLLRAAKEANNGAEKERDDIQALAQKTAQIHAENLLFEEQIDYARSRIFTLLLAQIKEGESIHTDEYVTLIDEAVRTLFDKDKKPKT